MIKNLTYSLLILALALVVGQAQSMAQPAADGSDERFAEFSPF